ncbi:GNAT family N-acetyltransferase [Paenibacillus nasutitermitis]|uniref:N-acetyltransferase domain-containing protein n=1 Tax=Paenibacillus nasutitermitis TaxID=1652958 RepID=A0A917DQR4_9BACL|nr:GNAT family N-acetyltransferase [Paenibacillus nasutitermitis]GGD57755.1 hypothetical protein GCM10010911_14430 [Paenibacillus nasutitermitis]
MKEERHPVIRYGGMKIELGPLQAEYTHLYYKWNRDFVLAKYSDKPDRLTSEEQDDAFLAFSSDPQFVFFTIYDKETKSPIGITYLERGGAEAEFAIIIGESRFHGRGYGREAAELVLDYAFTVLGLARVTLAVDERNTAAIRAYRKAGFKDSGRIANGHDSDNIESRQLTMICHSKGFQSPILKNLLFPNI